MNKLIHIAVLIFIGIIASSCDKNEGAYFPVPSAFSVTPTGPQSVAVDGSTIELSITAGNVGWWIESSEAWCTVSRKYGSGDGKVTLTIAKNTSGAARQAEVIVNPTFKLTPVKITINQQ